MRHKEWLAAAALGAALLGPATAHAQVNITANCQLTGTAQACTFTNTGSGTGSACATVHLYNASNRALAVDSTLACSRMLGAGETEVQAVAFPGRGPTDVCVMPDGTRSFDACRVDVRMSNLQTQTPPLQGLVWLVVLACALWVYVDAKRGGIRKGLEPGVGNLDPVGWAAGTLLLWIVVFPLYLAKRGRLKALAVAANTAAYGAAPVGMYGQAPNPYGPPPGYPPPGMAPPAGAPPMGPYGGAPPMGPGGPPYPPPA